MGPGGPGVLLRRGLGDSEGWGPSSVFTRQPGDSAVQSGLRASSALTHFAPAGRPRGNRPPPSATARTERRPRRPASGRPQPGARGSLHNGPRAAALSRDFLRPPPLLAPRQKEPGGAANMAERRRHKKRIQVARRSRGDGGFGRAGVTRDTGRRPEQPGGCLRGVAAP